MRTIPVLAFVLLLAAPAMAEDMSGRYQGPPPENTILDLVQTGGALQGTLHLKSGVDGTLQGQATANGGKGYIAIPGLGQAAFEAQMSPHGLLIRIFEEGQVTDAMFVRVGAGGAATGAVQAQPQPQPQSLAPAQPQATYYVGENGAAVGPLSLQQLVGRARGGALKPDQPVWTSATQAWGRADALPELREAFAATAPPAQGPVMYYVAENGAAVGPLTLDQVVERIRTGASAPDQPVWKSDGQAWVRADSLPELAAAFRAAGPPPPAGPAAVAYYVAENGAAVGPMTREQVLARARAGGLAPDQPVWKSDTRAWARADSLPELDGSLKPAAPQTPSAPPAAPVAPAVPGAPEAPVTGPAATAGPAAPGPGPAVDEPLRQTALAIAAAENPDGSSQAVNEAAECLIKALAPLSAEDRQQFLLDIRTGTPPADADRLEQEFPGLGAAVEGLEPRYPGLGHAVEGCI